MFKDGHVKEDAHPHCGQFDASRHSAGSIAAKIVEEGSHKGSTDDAGGSIAVAEVVAA